MKHKTWFRLVLKAIGVLFCATSASFLIMSALIIATRNSRFQVLGAQRGTFTDFVREYATDPITFIGLSFLPVGLYLFFGGEWIVNKAIPSNRPYCPSCGYDLSKRSGDNCPECGDELPSELRTPVNSDA